MISAQIRKGLTCLFQRNASFHFPSGLARHFFSTSTKGGGSCTQYYYSTTQESVASFMKEFGLSDTQLKNLFKRQSQLRCANLERSIKPKIKVLHDYGLSNSEIAEIISKHPGVLCCSLEKRLIPSLSFLNDLLNSSHDDLFKMLKRFGYGVPMKRILRLFITFPRSLYATNAALMKRIDKLESFGIHAKSTMYVDYFQVMGGMSDRVWEKKMQAFRDLGFTEAEILIIFKRAPRAFAASTQKLKMVTEMLLATEKYSKAGIVSYAVALCYSVENRLKPRLEILKILERMNLIERWPPLGVVIYSTNDSFHDTFVAPYLGKLAISGE
ncbi:hypothetical protein M569_14450 [Genlisea aurea]|uniref:Mitochondrial transcription termination factor family protein n=1 Tax=Genlisea aurea TaxID=192259 RepID=S8C125_9LAMI|nr:hypothetical protein M569_14450 [Genlisea aurea]